MLAEQVDPEETWGEDEHQNCRNIVLVPLWLGEILSNGYHPRIWNTLQTILKEDGLVECTIGDGDSAGSIERKKINNNYITTLYICTFIMHFCLREYIIVL